MSFHTSRSSAMADASMFQLEQPTADIAVLSINDPHKGANVLSRAALADFERHLATLEKRTDLAGLVIRSTKPGNFIAGADLREFVADLDRPPAEVAAVSRHGQELFARLSRAPFVTVAAIDGICVGGGSELAIWCDRRLMADNHGTSFGFPEVKLGLLPGWGGTARTPRIIGLSNAVELITSGEPIDAKAAYAMGLADVVEPLRIADRGLRNEKESEIRNPKSEIDVVPMGNGEEGMGKVGRASSAQSAIRNPQSAIDPLLDAAIRLIHAEQKSQQYLADRKQWSGPIEISDTELGFLGATASAYIQGQTKGQYPAPLAALEAMLGAAGADIAAACAIETEAFTPLFGSIINRSLLNVFFLRDLNKKHTGAATPITPREIRSATVIGAGIMGQGIAAANIKRGIPVALGDVTAEAIGRGVHGALAEASFNRDIKGPDVKRALELAPLLNGTRSDAELAAADIVIEAIYENAEAKKLLYQRLEPLLPKHAVLCSNTSTIPIAELAAGLERPELFCGLHFFNPVRQMPLVEVIRGRATSDDTVVTAVAYARRLGKSPIVVNDGPGFLVNRVLLPYMNEALLLLEEGAAIKQVDRAATAFGMPMGPIALYDTVGLDVAVHAGGVLQAAFPERVVPSTILPAMVAAGRLGKKVGRGFFDYGGKKKDRGTESAEAAEIIAANRRGEKKFSGEEITDRLFLPMLLEATRVLEDGVATSPRDVDLAMIFGTGFPPFRGGLVFWADTVGAAAIVEKLKPYQALGERFQPTTLLLSTAKSGKKFYDL